ncbi:hypothetical protein Dimus_038904 [Dionaea muscipula]
MSGMADRILNPPSRTIVGVVQDLRTNPFQEEGNDANPVGSLKERDGPTWVSVAPWSCARAGMVQASLGGFVQALMIHLALEDEDWQSVRSWIHTEDKSGAGTRRRLLRMSVRTSVGAG